MKSDREKGGVGGGGGVAFAYLNAVDRKYEALTRKSLSECAHPACISICIYIYLYISTIPHICK